MVDIHGTCEPRFDRLKDAFYKNFRIDEEVGAACSVYEQGEKIVDLWGGYAKEAEKEEWQEDTLCAIYSSGKPIVAASLLRQIDAGRIDLDDAVCGVWPEFAAAGKEQITFRQLLCHQSGVVAIANELPREAAFDWERMVSEVAAQAPWFEPGSRHVYHTVTFGFLMAEPVRRLTGMMPGDYLRQEIMGPLGDEMYFGVPDDALPQVAVMVREGYMRPADQQEAPATEVSDEDRMVMLAASNPPGIPDGGASPEGPWQQAQIPATNGHGTARAMAHFYGVLAMGGRIDDYELLSPELLKQASSVQSEGFCPSLRREVSFGLGFQITRPDRPFGAGQHAFGHYGNGGSLGYADPDTGIGFGYVMNYVNRRLQNSRNRNLMAALDSCI